ncbi:hypothetical protein O9993_12815 [Vibrio lentus]|nr:hypothetical protein [Vibrio lentus]
MSASSWCDLLADYSVGNAASYVFSQSTEAIEDGGINIWNMSIIASFLE